jgi:hypothetical protein
LTSLKDIVLPVEEWVVVPTVTDQDVPVGRPVSEKTREYCPGGKAVKVMDVLTATPLTVMVPDGGEAA